MNPKKDITGLHQIQYEARVKSPPFNLGQILYENESKVVGEKYLTTDRVL